MPKFTVILTRDITESCVIEVEATNIRDASDLAMQKLGETDNPGWEVDDGSCGTSPAYITDVSEE